MDRLLLVVYEVGSMSFDLVVSLEVVGVSYVFLFLIGIVWFVLVACVGLWCLRDFRCFTWLLYLVVTGLGCCCLVGCVGYCY